MRASIAKGSNPRFAWQTLSNRKQDYLLGVAGTSAKTSSSLVPLSRCMLFPELVMSDPCEAFEASVARCTPSNPNTPRLFGVNCPAALKPPAGPAVLSAGLLDAPAPPAVSVEAPRGGAVAAGGLPIVLRPEPIGD